MYAEMTAGAERGRNKRGDPLHRVCRRAGRILRRQRHRRFSKARRRRARTGHRGISPCAGAQPKAAGRRRRRHRCRHRHDHAAALRHVVAAAGATFSTPFTKLGLIPEAASSLLAPMRMGHARAFAMLVMGVRCPPKKRKRPGSSTLWSMPPKSTMSALKAAHEIAALPAGAVALSRRLMRGDLDEWPNGSMRRSMHFQERLKSDEARVAFAAFFARKK